MQHWRKLAVGLVCYPFGKPEKGEATPATGKLQRSKRMCLTTQALMLFLNIIGPDMITTEPDRVIVHATEADVHWVRAEDQWCTMGPQLDRQARFSLQ